MCVDYLWMISVWISSISAVSFWGYSALYRNWKTFDLYHLCSCIPNPIHLKSQQNTFSYLISVDPLGLFLDDMHNLHLIIKETLLSKNESQTYKRATVYKWCNKSQSV